MKIKWNSSGNTLAFCFILKLKTTLCYLLLFFFICWTVIPCHSLWFFSLVVIRCHSLSFVVIRCHSIYHSLSAVVTVVPLAVTFYTTRCHSLSFVVPHLVIRCHSLSLDVLLVCLFINDQFRILISLLIISTHVYNYLKLAGILLSPKMLYLLNDQVNRKFLYCWISLLPLQLFHTFPEAISILTDYRKISSK